MLLALVLLYCIEVLFLAVFVSIFNLDPSDRFECFLLVSYCYLTVVFGILCVLVGSTSDTFGSFWHSCLLFFFPQVYILSLCFFGTKIVFLCRNPQFGGVYLNVSVWSMITIFSLPPLIWRCAHVWERLSSKRICELAVSYFLAVESFAYFSDFACENHHSSDFFYLSIAICVCFFSTRYFVIEAMNVLYINEWGVFPILSIFQEMDHTISSLKNAVCEQQVLVSTILPWFLMISSIKTD